MKKIIMKKLAKMFIKLHLLDKEEIKPEYTGGL